MPGEFGDISDRNGITVSQRLLADSKENLVLSRWSLQQDIPKNKGKTINWRRYSNLDASTDPIVGNITPDGDELPYVDITATIQQFGSWVPVDQVIRDTHEDPVLKTAQQKLSFQMAKTLETLAFNVVVGGSNVIFTNGAARTAVNTVVNLKDFRAAVRVLAASDAMPITQLVRSTPDFTTHGIEASFFAHADTALEPAFRAMDGFLPVSEYSSRVEPLPGEIGNMERTRIIMSNISTPFEGAGATGGTNVIEDDSSNKAHVYPIILFGQEAFGTTKLAGMDAAQIKVVNPKPVQGDELGQRGSAGWITWYTAAILNDDFMVRIESAAPTDAGISN